MQTEDSEVGHGPQLGKPTLGPNLLSLFIQGPSTRSTATTPPASLMNARIRSLLVLYGIPHRATLHYGLPIHMHHHRSVVAPLENDLSRQERRPGLLAELSVSVRIRVRTFILLGFRFARHLDHLVRFSRGSLNRVDLV